MKNEYIHEMGLPNVFLRPHQESAVTETVNVLCDADRTQVIMACGSGKTLVGAMIAHRKKAQHVVIFEPSLALIRQTLRSLQKFGLLYNRQLLCVCSDKTVADNDDIQIDAADLDIPISTKPTEIEAVLLSSTTSTIFCTYASAALLANALPDGYSLDFGIFDEAHRTAGSVGGAYTFALDDDNLPVKQRLFLTATPKHSSQKNRCKDGELRTVFSMDNSTLYGDVAFNLSFRDAIDSGIICDYRLILSAVSNQDITIQLRDGSVIRNDVGDTKVSLITNQISLAKCMVQNGLRRAITFHRSVEEAKTFAQDEFELLARHDIKLFHVNGRMTTKYRDMIIAQFDAEPGPAVLTNSRCLGEGVDAPFVDLVGFMSAKESSIDIAQCVGRVLRPSHGKAFGHILLPLYVADATSEIDIRECVEREGYSYIWEVLQAMQEQDVVLGSQISHWTSEYARTGSTINRTFDQVRVLSDATLVNVIERAISTVAISKLSSTWDEHYGHLQAYKEEFGRDPGQGFIAKNGINLGIWCNAQRQMYKNGILDPERESKLNHIGFMWEVLEETWQAAYETLKAFQLKHGHCRLPPDMPMGDTIAQQWLFTQRKSYRIGRLSAERFKLLDKIGFVWQEETAFDRFIAHVKTLKDETGDISSPSRSAWPLMATWFRNVRKQRLANKLSEDQISKLDELGFVWETRDVHEERLSQLKAFKEEFGHCKVPYKTAPQYAGLREWLSSKRAKDANLTQSQRQELLDVGFVFNPYEHAWIQSFDALVEYRASHGGNFPTKKYKSNGVSLLIWHAAQLVSYRKGTLAQERVEKLKSNDLLYTLSEAKDKAEQAQWDSMYKKLAELHTATGIAYMPLRSPDPELYRWVQYQRRSFKEKTLSASRIDLLNKIEMVWDASAYKKKIEADKRKTRSQQQVLLVALNSDHKLAISDDRWRTKFLDAKATISTHGHTHELAKKSWAWVLTQLNLARGGSLDPWRSKFIENSGYLSLSKPNAAKKPLDLKIDLIRTAIEKWETCGEANKMETNFPEIATQMRVARKEGRMSNKQIALLDEMKFEWNPIELRWDAMYLAAKKIYDKVGSINKADLPEAIYAWIFAQRKANAEGKLVASKVQLLNDIGMSWKTRRDFFDENYLRLKAHHDRDGKTWHVGISRKDKKACQIIAHMRNLRQAGSLTEQQIAQLDQIAMKWHPRG